MTKQRELILKIVRGTDEHYTAEQIFLEAKKEMPSIALATVYNSLHYLTENVLIEKLSFRDRTDRYDKMLVRHDHCVCDRCGSIGDVTLPGLRRELEAETGETILSYELTLHYICPACRAAEGG